eukprot:TRINITY_DN11742_c0_g1_i1.p1 TRINITY_DN11742_c0_g1~~TRINITY_DN11742_c0_g1_i1.p1  ORF type:complete len:301 (-),score=58.53 TRINITY_DN11742_c0_g1_i1:96-998(-)
MTRFQRKLQALQYPHWDRFDIQDVRQFRTLIVWLEETKIRHYPVAQRAGLRNVDANDWNTTFSTYLQDLSFPKPFNGFSARELSSILDWLLGKAINLEYHDRASEFNQVSRLNFLARDTERPTLDCSSPEFRAALENLATALALPIDLDTPALLKGICDIVKAKLTPQQLEALAKSAEEKEEKKEARPASARGGRGGRGGAAARGGKSWSNVAADLANPSPQQPNGLAALPHRDDAYDLGESTLGFSTTDPLLDQAASTLRLLYVKDLQGLQHQINGVIAFIQDYTAHPKVNAALGKVGV